jgi:hypothetical protein
MTKNRISKTQDEFLYESTRIFREFYGGISCADLQFSCIPEILSTKHYSGLVVAGLHYIENSKKESGS